jgi:mannose/fructose/N-acetylgalactosamine-specific phosphotransferase system component IID
MAGSQEKLTKKELTGLWNRYMWFYNSQGNYTRFHGIGYVFSLIPLFKKYYDKEGQIERMKVQSGFFNTEMQLGSLLFGITVGLEEQKALGNDVEDGVITGTKIGLMGPLAGIGDSMIPGMLIPILLSIAIGLSSSGSIAGPIFYIVAYTAIIVFGSRFLFFKGYNLGVDSIHLLMGEKSARIRDAIILLGVTVMGAVAASYVSLSTILELPSGEEKVPLQGLLDGIFPKLLPLLLVIGLWLLLSKKKLSPLVLTVLLMACSFIFAALGVF